MKRFFKFFAIFLAVVFIIQAWSFQTVMASAKKISAPKISAKVSQKNKAVKITIDKTVGASWYVIEMCNTNIETQFAKVKKLKKDGTAKRSYTKKNLENGTYRIRVRAYAKNGKKTIKSPYSDEIIAVIGVVDKYEVDEEAFYEFDLSKYSWPDEGLEFFFKKFN